MSGQRPFSHGIATPFSQDEGRTSIILFVCNCKNIHHSIRLQLQEHPSFYSFATAKVVIIIGKSSYTNDGSSKKAELSHSVNHKKR